MVGVSGEWDRESGLFVWVWAWIQFVTMLGSSGLVVRGLGIPVADRWVSEDQTQRAGLKDCARAVVSVEAVGPICIGTDAALQLD